MELDLVEEIRLVPCIPTDLDSVRETLKSVGKSILRIPRIPSVIHVGREYGTFQILNEFEGKKMLILVRDNVKTEFNAEILLKFEYFTYTEIIGKLIGKELAPSSYETVGDIIHLNLTEEQLPYKLIIGSIIHRKTGRAVVNKTGKINNTYRNYELEFIGGEGSLRTWVCENGVELLVDLERVYWCSRLQREREEMLLTMSPGDTLCDPFCGVGPLVIPALKKGLRVFGNDLNPAAIECLRESLFRNKLNSSTVFCMDAGQFIKELSVEHVDHFVFNLPEFSLDYIKLIERFSGFRLHCFFFAKDSESPEEVVYKKTRLCVSPVYIRHVRKVSPSKSVYKLEITSDVLFPDN